MDKIKDTSSVSISIDVDVLERIRQILIEQRGNCSELLTIHDNSLGRTIKKNINIAQMYEDEIDQIDWAIVYLTQ